MNDCNVIVIGAGSPASSSSGDIGLVVAAA